MSWRHFDILAFTAIKIVRVLVRPARLTVLPTSSVSSVVPPIPISRSLSCSGQHREIAGGIWGIIDLLRQEVKAPLKSYGGAVSMMCGGFAMLGVAQALRILLAIIVVAASH